MRSSLPKMLHPVCGRPMVAWPILAAREAGAGRVAVIVSPSSDLSAGLPEGVETVVQPEPDGTGGALRAAIELIRDSETVVVLSGDHPVVSSEAIAGLLAVHRDADAGATVMTAVLEEPGSYGRIVRDPDSGDLARSSRRRRPATPTPSSSRSARSTPAPTPSPRPRSPTLSGGSERQRPGRVLHRRRPAADPRGRPAVLANVTEDEGVMLGVNTRAELALAEAESRRRILERHMLAGVTIVDPASTWVDADVEIAADARIEPGTSLRGAHRRRRRLDRRAAQHPDRHPARRRASSCPTPTWSSARSSTAARSAPSPTCGPAPRSRRGAKAGAFVEIKNSRDRRGREGPSPLLRRRRRGRRRQQPRRRDGDRQLRRFPQAPDGDRRPGPHRR